MTCALNTNIPDDVLILHIKSTMSGEIRTTYFVDKNGNLFACGDWADDKPYPITQHELYKQTGLTPFIIGFRED